MESFEGKEFKFTVERLPNCLVKFNVTVTPALAKTAHDKAVKEVTKHVSFPGFRKGKAPKELVVKQHQKSIDEQWKQSLADIVFPEAEKLANIPVLKRQNTIKFDVKSLSLENGGELTLQFETEPTLPKIDASKFEVQHVARPPVTEKEINETIRQIQFFFAGWKEIDRPIQEGDFVMLNVDIIDPPSNLFNNTRFEVTPHSMAKWMREAIIGKTVGDQVEATSFPDDDVSEEDRKNFEPKQARLTVLHVEEAIMPELNEKYYQGLGIANEEELRAYVTKLLNYKADEHVKAAERNQAVDFLLNHNPFDLPPSLINHEASFRYEQLNKDPEFKSYWESLAKEEKDRYVQTLISQSEKAVRLFYLSQHLLQDAKLTIGPEDLPPAPKIPLDVFLMPRQEYINPKGQLQSAEMYSRLMLEKVQDHIIAQAKAAKQTNLPN